MHRSPLCLLSLRDWKQFFAHEISEALRYRLASVIVGWLFITIQLTIVTFLLWFWPYSVLILAFGWPLVLASGLAIGIVGIVPVILLGKCIVCLWGDREEPGSHRRY